MTSGRRTVTGNRLVGGVPDSDHLSGHAGDWSGSNLAALLQEVRTLPGVEKAFIHKGNHVHAKGAWNLPYFGRNGTR